MVILCTLGVRARISRVSLHAVIGWGDQSYGQVQHLIRNPIRLLLIRVIGCAYTFDPNVYALALRVLADLAATESLCTRT